MQGISVVVAQSVVCRLGRRHMPAAGQLYASALISLMLVVLGAGRAAPTDFG